ncbi:MAG: hypothetical protein FWC97_09885, partial [Treponema sp.]|nr:hypothetical protein [Treponema sp.]
MNRFKKWLKDPLHWLLTMSLSISIFSLFVYLLEVSFTDEWLFFLLSVIRYSSFVAFVCSLYSFARS